MPERGQRRRRWARHGALLVPTAALLAVAVAVFAPTASAATASAPVTGWLSATAAFPQRTLVLAPADGASLTPARVHVTENGKPVSALRVIPVAAAPAGALGVMVVIDRSATMHGAGLRAAMAAARRLASVRYPGEKIGLVSFAARPTLVLPLTADGAAVAHALQSAPPIGSGSDPVAAVAAALTQLQRAHVAVGAVVTISDGDGAGAASAKAQDAVRAAAASSHTSVITLGLDHGAATGSSLHTLAGMLPGQFAAATPGDLPMLVKAVQHSLGGDYLVSYRSRAPYGRPVSLTAGVDGLPGSVSASYRAPSAPASSESAHAPVATPPPVPAHAPAATPLSPRPPFASAHSTAPTPPAAPATSAPPAQTSTPPPATSAAPVAGAATNAAPAAGAAFWGTPRAALAVSGACALLLTLGLSLVLYRPSRRAVRVRIGSFIPATEEVVEDPLSPPPPRRKGMFVALQRGSWWPPFVEAVEISRIGHSPSDLVKRAAALGVIAGVLLGLVSGIPFLGIVPVLAWPFLLRSYVNRVLGKQRVKFGDGLPSYLQDLASSIRVGRSFVGALTAIAESADQPTRGEFERAVTNEALGLPLEECLETVARRMQSSDMDQVALIAGLNRRSGSNVAESLDRVAEGSRDRADLRREMRALTSQARMSSFVLTSLPGVLLVGLSVISPMYSHPLFHTTLGWVALAVGAMMCFSGWKVMQKITNVGGV